MRDHEWPEGAWLAEFADAATFRRAVAELLSAGYARLEIYSPVPLDDLHVRLGYRRSRLPWVVLAGGIAGGLVSYGIQWYANVLSYPLNIGGRPIHAIPAFLVATFEGTVLFAGLGAFFGFLAAVRLPRLWHPLFEIDGFERASIDRYFLAIDRREHPGRDLAAELTRLGATRVLTTGRTP